MIEIDKYNGKTGVKFEGTDSDLMLEFCCLAAALMAKTNITMPMLIAGVQAGGSQKMPIQGNHTSEIFIRRLMHLLEIKSIKLTDFAKDLGISDEQMHIYISGKSYPSIHELKMMSNRLDVPFDYLIGGEKK